MSLLSIHHLTCHLGDKTLYQDASFTLLPREHICITGRNGVGKSTCSSCSRGSASLMPGISSGSPVLTGVTSTSMPSWTGN